MSDQCAQFAFLAPNEERQMARIEFTAARDHRAETNLFDEVEREGAIDLLKM